MRIVRGGGVVYFSDIDKKTVGYDKTFSVREDKDQAVRRVLRRQWSKKIKL